MSPHIVQFDKTYLTGPLAGLTVAGQTCTYPDYKSARRYVEFLAQVIKDDDFIRHGSTGAKYTVSNVRILEIDTLTPEEDTLCTR